VQTCFSFFGCGGPLETDAGLPARAGADPERARALLAEAGYAGEPLIVLHPTDILFMNIATLVLAEQLKAVGVTVDLQAMDFGTLASRRSNRAAPGQGGWHLGLTYWPGASIVDPVGHLPLQANCERAWPGWPCDSELQALIERFPYVTDPTEQKTLADAISRRAFEVVPYVPIGQWFQPAAYRPELKGVLPAPGTTVFWNIEKSTDISAMPEG
jgi:peptide/nickel transport system substrate-binding protein